MSGVYPHRVESLEKGTEFRERFVTSIASKIFRVFEHWSYKLPADLIVGDHRLSNDEARAEKFSRFEVEETRENPV